MPNVVAVDLEKRRAIAARFVGLALKHSRQDWNNKKEFSVEELVILLETAKAAGHDAVQITPGELRGDYRDQDGSATGETYSINGWCMVTVFDREGSANYFASGWLSTLLARVTRYRTEAEQIQQKIENVVDAIKRSIPLEPIKLTADDDFLQEYPPVVNSNEFLVDHTRDSDELGHTVGVHVHCNGWIDRTNPTKTYDILLCRSCHLRIKIPLGIKTYGELRRGLANVLETSVKPS